MNSKNPSTSSFVVSARALRIALLLLVTLISAFNVLATPPPNVVFNTNDTGPSSLRTVIAVATNNATITFDPGIYGQTITLTSGEILVTKNLTLAGPGAANITVSGNNSSRVFHVKNATVALSGMAVIHGKAVGGNGGNGNGGGGGGGGFGGGLLADNGAVMTVNDIVFTANTAKGGNGGGNNNNGSGAAGGAGNGGTTGYLATGFDAAAGANPGGGGAGSSSGVGASNPGGAGAFGGGGGGAGGQGSFSSGNPLPQGGASVAFGGNGGSGDVSTTGGGGGGGAGLGGAVCVWQGASIVLSNVTFNVNNASGGSAGASGARAGATGQGKGGAIFVYPGGLAQATNLTFSENSAQNSGETAFAVNQTLIDNEDVWGAFMTTTPQTGTVLHPTADLWTDGYGDYYPDDTETIPGQPAEVVANDDLDYNYDTTAIRFDLSSISGTVSQAVLQFYVCYAAGDTTFYVGWIDNTSWNENSELTYGEWSQFTPTTTVKMGAWKSIDITSYVTSQMSGSKIASLILQGNGSLDYSPTGDYFVLASRETTIAALQPQLFITAAGNPQTALALGASPNPSTYGDTVTLTAIVTPQSGSATPTGTVIFKDGGVQVGSVSLAATNGGAFAAYATNSLSGGSHSISAEYAGDQTVIGSTNSLSLTVNLASQASFSLSAPSTEIYGATSNLTTLGGSGSGAVTYSVLSGPGVITNTDELYLASGQGSVTVQAVKASDGNYAAATNSAVVSALPAVLTPTNILGDNKLYDGTTAATLDLTNAALLGVINGDDVSLDATNAVANFATPNIGAQTVTFSGFALAGPAAGNYTLAIPNPTTTAAILAAPVALIVTNVSQIYSGAPESIATAAFPVIPLHITYDGSSSPPTTAGSYSVAISSADSNYVASTNFTFVISPAPLTLSVSNVTRLYGQTNPVFTVAADGFVNNETLANLSGATNVTFTDTNSEPLDATTNTGVGVYWIVLGGLTSTNYAIAYTNATLTIDPAILNVTADNAGTTYGSPLPAFSYEFSGFVNGETTNVLSGVPTLTCSAISGSSVAGSPYVISITNGTLSASNYAFAFTDAALTIQAATLGVTANNALRAYGQPNPTFSGTITGVTNDDPITALFTTVATPSSPAGIYPITPQLLDPDSFAVNYNVTPVPGHLDITAAFLLSSNAVNYVLGGGPGLLDTNATVADGGSIDFAGATLVITSLTNADSDVLNLNSQGTNAGQISTMTNSVLDGGVAFATYALSSNTLSVSFGTNDITSAMLSALLRQATFATAGTNLGPRLIQIVLTYGSNSISATHELILDNPPIANDLSLSATRNTVITLSYSDLLTNASDPDADLLTIAGISSISDNGNVVSTNLTSLTYTPPGDFAGPDDSFTYTVSDGRGGEATGTITLEFIDQDQINITPSNISSNGAQISFGGIPGQTYEIETSTNLLDWSILDTVVATPAGVIEILDEDAKNLPWRFYRAFGPLP